MMEALVYADLLTTVIIIILCSIIYWKTRDSYVLTQKKSIAYFRNTFLFLAISYVFRLVFHLARTILLSDLPKGTLFPFFIIIIGYVSTIAWCFLLLSVWKKNFNLYVPHIFALVVSLLAALLREPLILIGSQALLLGFALYLVSSKKSIVRVYILLFISWIIGMFAMSPRRFFPEELMLVAQVASAVIFILIYNKVTKWAR